MRPEPVTFSMAQERLGQLGRAVLILANVRANLARTRMGRGASPTGECLQVRHDRHRANPAVRCTGASRPLPDDFPPACAVVSDWVEHRPGSVDCSLCHSTELGDGDGAPPKIIYAAQQRLLEPVCLDRCLPGRPLSNVKAARALEKWNEAWLPRPSLW
jgi:hypothetical protein